MMYVCINSKLYNYNLNKIALMYMMYIYVNIIINN